MLIPIVLAILALLYLRAASRSAGRVAATLKSVNDRIKQDRKSGS